MWDLSYDLTKKATCFSSKQLLKMSIVISRNAILCPLYTIKCPMAPLLHCHLVSCFLISFIIESCGETANQKYVRGNCNLNRQLSANQEDVLSMVVVQLVYIWLYVIRVKHVINNKMALASFLCYPLLLPNHVIHTL